MFAGEATHDHYYSTLHAAYATGVREANRIVQWKRLQQRALKNSL
jgi:Flavin containing amine oxidoreductase